VSTARKRIALPTAHRLLTNPLTARFANDDKLRRLLTDFVLDAHSTVFEAGLEQILKTKRVQATLPAFSRDIEWFCANGFMMNVPRHRLLQLYLGIFRFCKAELIHFIELRDKVEHAILISNFTGALDILDDIEANFGESIWLSRSKMLVLSRVGDRDRFIEYCKLCEVKSNNTFNTFILKCSQVIADSGNASIQLSNLVGRNITELREAKTGYLSSFLEVLFVPQPLKQATDNVSCLPYFQGYPVIDQYTMILAMLRSELINENAGQESRSELVDFARKIAKEIPDRRTTNLAIIDDVLSAGPKVPFGPAKAMLDSYNGGEYETSVKLFLGLQHENDETLSFVNVAAKAMAYCGRDSTLDNTSPLAVNVSNSLSTIYRLSPLWYQAEEQLTSLSIQYNHLSHGPFIQLSLLKALTFRYRTEAQRAAARQAISLTDACTPQTFVLAGKEPGRVNPAPAVVLPPHRILKEEIQRELSSPAIDSNFVVLRLEQLSSTNALAKDLVECHSRFLYRVGNDTELVREAAKNLIIDANRFVCYPMDHLIDAIETLGLHDLCALIVAYHYNISVSDERDYVLNESFGKFIREHSGLKPSEILLSKAQLNAEETVFFRDICVPDVMDYLGIFKNSNDLRSERLRILDALESKGSVDSTTRMREVEEIVRQVIVDTGTSELNGAKIFVDDNALKRKHLEEVRSLLALYEKIPQGSDERYTKIDSDNSKGGYVSGSRNSLIERLYTTISNSFVFDDKYGLDRNLSAEIRHGFFSNLMRARLEELHLLTELDEKGSYLPNLFWKERNSLVRDVYWNDIDALLASFSRKFDATVAEAEEWMKINIQTDEGTGMFSFELTMDEFGSIRKVVERTGDADYVCSHIFDVLWWKTDSALSALRDRLNGDFKGSIDAAFADCIQELTVAKGELALFDLMQALTRARNEIQEDINTASEWLNKTKNSEINAGNLLRLIEIAVRSFEKVRGNAFSINISPLDEISHIAVNSQVTKPFILAIINLLDNCYTHSGLGQDTQVEITGRLLDDFSTVAIRNDLSLEKQTQLDSSRLAEIRKKLKSTDISRHIRGEGGTGLIKANLEISYLGRDSRLEVSRDSAYFNASITYNSRVTL